MFFFEGKLKGFLFTKTSFLRIFFCSGRFFMKTYDLLGFTGFYLSRRRATKSISISRWFTRFDDAYLLRVWQVSYAVFPLFKRKGFSLNRLLTTLVWLRAIVGWFVLSIQASRETIPIIPNQRCPTEAEQPRRSSSFILSDQLPFHSELGATLRWSKQCIAARFKTATNIQSLSINRA